MKFSSALHTVVALALLAAPAANARRAKPKPRHKAPAQVQRVAEVKPEPRNAPAYSAKIREYTTEPFFLTELVDHLPASDTVPSPDKILGYPIGTPDKLTYSKDIYRYMRALEAATPRVRVFPIGKTEEGREMLVVAVSDEANMRRLDRIREITAKLADPRKTGEEEAKKLIAEGVPLYWATGSIHSTETGSPEMLMELAYRLAVEETPFIQNIRKNSVVMITPLVEVDGHDKVVDVYNYRKANPGKPAPQAVYWGKYVAHDNNRDGMALSLALSRNLMQTFFDFHPQVLHDLHESIPYLYISTGMGPFNAWLDPIVTDEWESLAWREVEEMRKRGVPGVWTHGFYDGWAANYMFYIANGHNSIGRFYETFGGRGADTFTATLEGDSIKRTWFRNDPPLPKVKWSIRNNINLQQSALLFGMSNVAENGKQFLENFYLKSKRSIAKPFKEGPAAYVIPSDDPRPVQCAELVNLLRRHGIEVQRAERAGEFDKQKFPAGSYVIRMDQPYSRMADMLLDTQYYSTTDTRPYDDTGWTLGPLRDVKTVRIADTAILKAPMSPLSGAAKVPGAMKGDSAPVAYLINHNTDNTLATLRFRLRNVRMSVAEEPFQAAGYGFRAGTFVIRPEQNPLDLRERLEKNAAELGLTVWGVASMPKVATHDLPVPRIALVHTWQSTQNEGWVRLALESVEVPYAYISGHTIRDTADLRSKYDVIIFGPTPGSPQRIVNGIPMRGAPMPWRRSDLMPNVGTSPDQTDDMRGGMGLEGLLNLKKFVEDGGLFVTIAGNAAIPIDFGLTDGVSISQTRELQVRGSVLNATFADRKSPIAYGYGEKLAVYFNQAPAFQVSRTGGLGRFGREASSPRASGRGTPSDPDVPQGRAYVPAPPKPEVKPGEEPPIPEEDLEYIKPLLPPVAMQPRVVLRFADEKNLLVSGMLAGGKELANRPAVVDVPVGKGHIVMFANNPMWRQETQGSFFLLFNAALNYNNLQVGR